MPSTKQMASRMLDLPDPLSPVIALKRGSNPGTVTREAYDLKPSMMISEMCMVRVRRDSGVSTSALAKTNARAREK